MAQRILNALQLDRVFYEVQNTWENSCNVFESALLEQT
jgi:hypothetical protein